MNWRYLSSHSSTHLITLSKIEWDRIPTDPDKSKLRLFAMIDTQVFFGVREIRGSDRGSDFLD